MTTDILYNARQLALDPEMLDELVRIYDVTLVKPDLLDDDGQPIAYDVRVSLRYPCSTERRAESREAHAEACRRAMKLERTGYITPDDRRIVADNARFVREMVRPGRAAR